MRTLALVVVAALLSMAGLTPAAASNFAPGDSGAISGTIARSNGSAVVGGSINIRAIKAGASHATVFTNASGYFELNDVTPGTYWVKSNTTNAQAPGDVHEQYFEDEFGWIPVEVEAGFTTTGVDFQLEAAGSVSGVVTYDSSVSAAVIAMNPVRVTAMRTESTDRWAQPYGASRAVASNGSYTLTGLLPGKYTLRFSDLSGDRIDTEYFNDAAWVSDSSIFEVVAGGTSEFDATVGTGTVAEHEITRFGGQDRFEAAVSLTTAAIETGDDVPVIYIVNGLGYADALSAGPAAAFEGGALLTVRPTAIPAVVQSELERLNPDRIEIVGGPASVSEAVKAQLQLIAPTTRITGDDRYDVSRAVASKVWGADGLAEAFMVTGHNFPDALSAGSVAAIRGGAVVLVNSYVSLGVMTPLDAPTRELLVDLGVGEVHIVGGPASVTTRIENDLIAMPELYLVDRFGGEDRFEASSNLAAAFPQADSILLATGYNYPDALAGSWIAGRAGGAVVLIPGTCIPSAAAALIKDVKFIGILGGTASVSTAAENGVIC